MNRMYFFYSDIALKIIEAAESRAPFVEVSLDLNLSVSRFAIDKNILVIDETTSLDISMLGPVVQAPNKVFYLKGNTLTPAEVRGPGYFKLVPTNTAPTLEINGIKMHRSKDIDPLTDARLKTQQIIKQGDVVLDTCGGLGYSAMYALKAGAKKVISTEKEKAVLDLRSLNPWLEASDNLSLHHADIAQIIHTFDNKTFDSVLHDPPRFCSATGDLYGKVFYQSLFRVMKPGGRLFHYTGSPRKIKHNDRFLINTSKRLEQTGFRDVKFLDRLQGFIAVKNTH